MLVLGRKVGQEIIIGPNVVVRVGAIKGNRAQIEIDAPRSVPIRRAELPARPGEEPPEEPRDQEAA